MWLSNRKNAYKIVRYVKSKDEYVLQGEYAQFMTPAAKAAASGYKEIKRRPR